MRYSLAGRARQIAAALALMSSGFPANAMAGQAATVASATEVDRDHTVVFELGAAGDWSRSEPFHPGGTFAVEFTPIEGRLEVETGVTAIRATRSTEIGIDLLLKKPWQITRAFEFMAGAGPEVVRATGTGRATFGGLEAVADFMVWPRANVGWYVEPGYELTFHGGGKHYGAGIAVGLIIGR